MSSRESNNCVGPKAVFNVVARIELQIVLSPMFVGQIHGDLSGWDVVTHHAYLNWWNRSGLRRSRPIYAALEPLNVNVVGNRVTGVDVGCFHLRGKGVKCYFFHQLSSVDSFFELGYSCKTTQHGLTIDTVAYELVKPNGDVVTATKASDSELFFGLKGGFNNFGIVAKFTLQTFPQTQVWGGLITITAPFIPDVAAATAAFAANVNDPKASIITTYNFLLGQPGISNFCFTPDRVLQRAYLMPSSPYHTSQRMSAREVTFPLSSRLLQMQQLVYGELFLILIFLTSSP